MQHAVNYQFISSVEGSCMVQGMQAEVMPSSCGRSHSGKQLLLVNNHTWLVMCSL
jgi:hypothetical protein